MRAQFCAECGARLTMSLIHGREREHCPACGVAVYHTPAPIGMALVERDHQVVLIRRTAPPLQGYWAPPAGHVELGESVTEATIRETREETGLEIVLDELVNVYSRGDANVVIVAYRARATGGEPKAGDDASEVGLFAPGRIPIQPPPDESSGTALDRWFYGVIQEVTAPWREAPAGHP
jgi:ADP-ribose pyrophosphatase YjhB (NUDIX family)